MEKKFKIFVRGRNYLLKPQDEIARKYGFYVTVFIEARNSEEAEALAVDVLKKDSKIFDACKNSESDAPNLSIESSEEIESFDGCTIPRTGLVLYEEEETRYRTNLRFLVPKERPKCRPQPSLRDSFETACTRR